MNDNAGRPPLVCVVGPTGTGKSAAAIALARRFDGEVVSADSRQVYRGMDIGTAKVGEAERAGVPHHLLDIRAPNQPYSVHEFARDAERAIAAIHARGRLPIVAGGTGHYLAALTRGFLPAAVEPNPALRAELERLQQEQGVVALAERLRAVDPIAAEDIDLENPRRLVRAIEVRLATGKSIREVESERDVPWRPLVLGLNMERETLAERIAARAAGMFGGGLLDEIRGLLAGGYGRGSVLDRSIGYKEGLRHLFGDLSRREAIAATTIATRQYARRQMTWLRNRESAQWFEVGDNLEEELAATVGEFLATGDPTGN
jgi:tRNA dimethylallyltransferase